MLKKILNQMKISIFARLFLVLFIAIIFFYGVSLSINMRGIDNLKSETARTMISKTQYFINSFENEINRIMQQQVQFINDDDLQTLSMANETMTSFQKIQAITNVQRRLQLLQNVSSYIDNVEVFIPSINKMIRAHTIINSINMDEFDKLSHIASVNKKTITYLDKRLLLSMSYPSVEYENTEKKPLYILVIELSEKSITRDITDFFNSGDDGGAILFDKSVGWVLGSNPSYLSRLGKNAEKLPDNPHKEYTLNTITIDDNSYFAVNNSSKFLNCTLFAYVPQKSLLNSMMMYRKRIIFLSVLSVLMLALFSIWMYNMFSKPVSKLLKAFGIVEGGNLDFYIEHTRNDEFKHIYNKFNYMVQKLKQLIYEVYEDKIRYQQAELKQLQYQINPHFLYNSLYMIRRMAVVGDCESITMFSKHLGSYYQYITRTNMSDVTLFQEVEHMRNYVEIQTMRCGDRIIVDCDDIPEECRDIKVPPLILQPIIENAYTHGLKDKLEGGHIWVRMIFDNDVIVIEIEDNGQGVGHRKLAEIQKALNDCEKLDDITGITNVNKRLKIRYGNRSGVEISQTELEGCSVRLLIPVERGEENVSASDCG